ncbi:hypothetical protein GCM10009836_19610 [Pseudonocardia ailaonensis]|uniref:EfeO-type cupredoxin-like domain-containing protein n=1 Tax=Pseudonocardia ailaonensis TaxID=367279 RepID=A0ABN2MW02_9PSEU
MRSRAGGVLAVLALTALTLAGCGSGTPPEGSTTAVANDQVGSGASARPAPLPSTPAAPAVRTIAVSFARGKVSGETGRVPVARGETVELVVTSDVAEEAHLHGYDRAAQIPAGGTATIRLVADVPGVFAFELHHSGAELLSLRVA